MTVFVWIATPLVVIIFLIWIWFLKTENTELKMRVEQLESKLGVKKRTKLTKEEMKMLVEKGTKRIEKSLR